MGVRSRLRAALDALLGRSVPPDDSWAEVDFTSHVEAKPEVETVSPVKLAPYGMLTVDFDLAVRVHTHPSVAKLLAEGWEPMGVHHVLDADGERWGRLYLRRAEA